MACVTLDFHNIWENFDISGKHSTTNIRPRICRPILVFCIIIQSYLESDYQNYGGRFCLTLHFWCDDESGRSVPYVIQSKIFTSSQPRGPLFNFFTAIITWDLYAELLLIQIFIWLHYSCDVVSRNKKIYVETCAVRMAEGEMCSMCWY